MREDGPTAPNATTATEGAWTTRRLLQWVTEFLARHAVDAPRLCAELLLSHVFNCERTRLYMEVDRPASPDERARLREMVRRAAAHEPVQYLVGETWFYARPMFVDRSTLIPRPSTETLVEQAVQFARGRNGGHLRMLDLCTGSGCVAISVVATLITPRRGAAATAENVPSMSVVASDCVAAATSLALRNATRHGVQDRIEFRVGDLYEVLQPSDVATFDLVVANPPYISDIEWTECAPNVRDHEPATALRGGPDGLRILTPLIHQASKWMTPGGRLLVEIAASQGAAVRTLVQAEPALEFRDVVQDHEGLDRVLVADCRGECGRSAASAL